MKEIQELNLPLDVRYTEDHEWARLEGSLVRVGLDDYAQDQLGDIVFVELPEVGSKLSKKTVFATVESTKAVSECYMPISGEVVEINEALLDSPQAINEDPYGQGWMIVVQPDDAGQLETLNDQKACLAKLQGA